MTDSSHGPLLGPIWASICAIWTWIWATGEILFFRRKTIDADEIGITARLRRLRYRDGQKHLGDEE